MPRRARARVRAGGGAQDRAAAAAATSEEIKAKAALATAEEAPRRRAAVRELSHALVAALRPPPPALRADRRRASDAVRDRHRRRHPAADGSSWRAPWRTPRRACARQTSKHTLRRCRRASRRRSMPPGARRWRRGHGPRRRRRGGGGGRCHLLGRRARRHRLRAGRDRVHSRGVGAGQATAVRGGARCKRRSPAPPPWSVLRHATGALTGASSLSAWLAAARASFVAPPLPQRPQTTATQRMPCIGLRGGVGAARAAPADAGSRSPMARRRASGGGAAKALPAHLTTAAHGVARGRKAKRASSPHRHPRARLAVRLDSVKAGVRRGLTDSYLAAAARAAVSAREAVHGRRGRGGAGGASARQALAQRARARSAILRAQAPQRCALIAEPRRSTRWGISSSRCSIRRLSCRACSPRRHAVARALVATLGETRASPSPGASARHRRRSPCVFRSGDGGGRGDRGPSPYRSGWLAMLLPHRAVLHGDGVPATTSATFAARCGHVCVRRQPVASTQDPSSPPRRRETGGGRGSSSDMHMASGTWKPLLAAAGEGAVGVAARPWGIGEQWSRSVAGGGRACGE